MKTVFQKIKIMTPDNAYRNTLICFIGELLSYTLTPKWLPYYLHSVFSFGWGMAGVFFLYQGITHHTITLRLSRPYVTQSSRLWGVLLGITVIFAGYGLWGALHKFENYADSSDVIPQACKLAQRFWNGEKVYQTIHFSGYDLEPTYLPFSWLPFSLTEFFGIDPRLICLFIWLAVILWILFRQKKEDHSWHHLGISSLLFSLILGLFARYNPEDVSVSIELLHAAYYAILVYGLMRKNYLLIGASLVFILLSRYAVVLWLPLLGGIYFFHQSQRKTIFVIGSVVLAVFLLYVLPFMILTQDYSAFARGFEYYNRAAVGEWHPHPWQKPTDMPFHLFRGLGFAGWAYKFLSGTVEDKITFYKTLQYVILAFSTLITGYFLWKNLKKGIPLALSTVWGLKIYLLLFYHFILIPYSYLFLIPITVSGVILTLSQKNRLQ